MIRRRDVYLSSPFQVRAEGRFDPILRQPIKGRKVGGGVRLGEMERDCLLSHGLAFTLQDRLMSSNCDRVKVSHFSLIVILRYAISNQISLLV